MSDRINRVVSFGGTTLTQGRGLRPVLRYATNHPVDVVRVDTSVADPTRVCVAFYFAPTGSLDLHASCATSWADPRVLIDWLCARRSWSFHRLNIACPHVERAVADHPGLRTLRARGVEVRLPARVAA